MPINKIRLMMSMVSTLYIQQCVVRPKNPFHLKRKIQRTFSNWNEPDVRKINLLEFYLTIHLFAFLTFMLPISRSKKKVVQFTLNRFVFSARKCHPLYLSLIYLLIGVSKYWNEIKLNSKVIIKMKRTAYSFSQWTRYVLKNRTQYWIMSKCHMYMPNETSPKWFIQRKDRQFRIFPLGSAKLKITSSIEGQ